MTRIALHPNTALITLSHIEYLLQTHTRDTISGHFT